MRNYRDLQVWEKAHKLTVAIYTGHARFSERGAIWFDQPDPAIVGFDRGELGGRLWPQISEMARFIQTSMGSSAELSYHLLLAKDLGMLTRSSPPLSPN
jgi:hypothetical protein